MDFYDVLATVCAKERYETALKEITISDRLDALSLRNIAREALGRRPEFICKEGGKRCLNWECAKRKGFVASDQAMPRVHRS